MDEQRNRVPELISAETSPWNMALSLLPTTSAFLAPVAPRGVVMARSSIIMAPVNDLPGKYALNGEVTPISHCNSTPRCCPAAATDTVAAGGSRSWRQSQLMPAAAGMAVATPFSPHNVYPSTVHISLLASHHATWIRPI